MVPYRAMTTTPTKTKLNPKQLAVFQAVAARRVYLSESPGTHGQSFADIHGVRQNVTPTTLALQRRKLIQLGNEPLTYRLGRWWELSPDGDDLLATLGKDTQ